MSAAVIDLDHERRRRPGWLTDEEQLAELIAFGRFVVSLGPDAIGELMPEVRRAARPIARSAVSEATRRGAKAVMERAAHLELDVLIPLARAAVAEGELAIWRVMPVVRARAGATMGDAPNESKRANCVYQRARAYLEALSARTRATRALLVVVDVRALYGAHLTAHDAAFVAGRRVSAALAAHERSAPRPDVDRLIALARESVPEYLKAVRAECGWFLPFAKRDVERWLADDLAPVYLDRAEQFSNEATSVLGWTERRARAYHEKLKTHPKQTTRRTPTENRIAKDFARAHALWNEAHASLAAVDPEASPERYQKVRTLVIDAGTRVRWGWRSVNKYDHRRGGLFPSCVVGPDPRWSLARGEGCGK